jgi:hypothetical protein
MEVEEENFAAYKGLKARGCDLMNMDIDECHKNVILARVVERTNYFLEDISIEKAEIFVNND